MNHRNEMWCGWNCLAPLSKVSDLGSWQIYTFQLFEFQLASLSLSLFINSNSEERERERTPILFPIWTRLDFNFLSPVDKKERKKPFYLNC